MTSIDDRMELWKRMMPRVEVFYAAKCNFNEGIMSQVIKRGGGFDVASPNEMEKALELGSVPEDLIFANPMKSEH